MFHVIEQAARGIDAELCLRLPTLGKPARKKLSTLIAAMLEARSPNTRELVQHLPLETDRLDMREQWIRRFLSNERVDIGEVMHPFAKELISMVAKRPGELMFMIDQSQIRTGMQLLMISIRMSNRALPLIWSVKECKGNIPYEDYAGLIEKVSSYIPEGVTPCLAGDRFYGCPDLISDMNERGWDYLLRLQNKFLVCIDGQTTTTGEMAKSRKRVKEKVILSSKEVPTYIGVLQEEGYDDPWIIAMSKPPTITRLRAYGKRWGIENLFSDFKTRGFNLHDTQLQHEDRIERMILIMSLAAYFAVSTGLWDKHHNAEPWEKNRPISDLENSSDRSLPYSNAA